ncbi:hypothetical protein BDL97_06G079800 [Sphagnum fallax]|nr:hypothetical protein BDL97_06G079800 [Sphagnum fallax]
MGTLSPGKKEMKRKLSELVTLSSEEKNKKMKRKWGENGAEDGSLRNSKQKKAVKHEHERSGREKQLICSREKSIKVGENSSAKKKSSTLEATVKGVLLSGNSSQKQAGISKSSSFLDKMRARLKGGQFRMLNETLYTCRGEDAFKLFQKDSGAFQMYHTGYQEQMSHWPQQPVQVIVDWLKAHSPKLVVADFGCGDAQLAKAVKNKVFSLDLVACDDSVIACNMAHTPLETASIDVAVFCLSLMGVDYSSFLKEAYRVLKIRGVLLIAEVKSRFDAAKGGADSANFVKALKGLGFSLISQDLNNKMFVMFYLQKQGGKSATKAINWPDLKPCIYKKR